MMLTLSSHNSIEDLLGRRGVGLSSSPNTLRLDRLEDVQASPDLVDPEEEAHRPSFPLELEFDRGLAFYKTALEELDPATAGLAEDLWFAAE